MQLLGEKNAKTVKGEDLGFLSGILYLLPSDSICPMSSLAKCRKPCLVSAGRGRMASVEAGRRRKTALFESDPVAFCDTLAEDIATLCRRAERRYMTPCVRLNGTSDIPWEHFVTSSGKTLFELFPTVQFYDYTKLPKRKVPPNYHLTVSYSGANAKYAEKALSTEHNIAVVFGDGLPSSFAGRRVVDGDAHDLRFMDDSGVVVGLKAKGAAKHDTSGFVVYNNLIASA